MTSPLEPHTKSFSHINGGTSQLLDRFAVTELCKGWPVYRDNSEWMNYRDLFTDSAKVWTTWSGPLHIDDFIAVSKKGKAAGVFISHRECGTLAELSIDDPTRAVGKMKATITQRFRFPIAAENKTNNAADSNGTQEYVEFDVDCDCRFIFFCTKATGEWKTQYVKLFYEKDKIVPSNGHTAPEITAEEREFMRTLPEGYKFLGIMQRRLNYQIDLELPTPRNEGWGNMYSAMEEWLAGKDDIKL